MDKIEHSINRFLSRVSDSLTAEQIEIMRDVLISFWVGGGYNPKVVNTLCDMALRALQATTRIAEMEKVLVALRTGPRPDYNESGPERGQDYFYPGERGDQFNARIVRMLNALASPVAKDADEA